MANKKQKNESNQEKKQPTTPATQVELNDEELKQVTGGAIRLPYSTAVQLPCESNPSDPCPGA